MKTIINGPYNRFKDRESFKFLLNQRNYKYDAEREGVLNIAGNITLFHRIQYMTDIYIKCEFLNPMYFNEITIIDDENDIE